MNDKNEWKPSKNQALFIDLYIDITNRMNLIQLCKKVGITRQTAWRWFQNSDFTDYLNSKRDQILARSQTTRMLVAVRKALSGDNTCLKMLFEIEGIYTPKMRTQTDMKIDLGETKDVKKEIIDKLNAMAKRSKRSKERKKGK